VPGRVAAAVVSYNTRSHLERCLGALEGTETWVVDNGSADGSPELVRERFPHVHLEARSDNLGFGAAANRAAELAGDWDWLAIANADTAPEPGALGALLEAGGRDRGAGVLAPRLILDDGSTQHSLHPFWGLRLALAFNTRRQRRDPAWADAMCLEGFTDLDRERRVPWAIGAFLVVRRDVWEAAGGFDPGQWMYAEDLDLGWRVARAGWATRYVPAARVRHAESAATAAAWGDARTRYWMAASYDWMLRRRGALRTRGVAVAFIAGALASGAPGWARLHALGLLPHRRLRARLPRPPG
jgi:N-acetylglucosaminyl-diphospho-decaprenol L-rhamnosyltransferase